MQTCYFISLFNFFKNYFSFFLFSFSFFLLLFSALCKRYLLINLFFIMFIIPPNHAMNFTIKMLIMKSMSFLIICTTSITTVVFLVSVCQLVNSSIVALVAIADCRFQSYLSLRTESHLPLPLIVVGVGTPCPNVAWDGRVFVGTNRYHWLPHAVGDLLAFLETSQLMIVYSEECELEEDCRLALNLVNLSFL